MNLAALEKHKTKDRQATDQAAVSAAVPALLAERRNLGKLRYDYPLVLVDDLNTADQEFIHSLSGIFNQILQEIAPPGGKGEQTRNHLLRLEQEIRSLVLQGNGGDLAGLWELAATSLITSTEESDSLEQSFNQALACLRIEGDVIDCNGETPYRVLKLAWSLDQKKRADEFRFRINRLIVKLTDILHADYHKSEAALEPGSLERSVGTGFESVFDFAELSRVLATAAAADSLSDNRRHRIQATLDTLESQCFFALAPAANKEIYSFEFDNCVDAVTAFDQRLPDMVALIKAIFVADLEIDNTYDEARHDDYFDRFDETSLTTRNVAMFPSYLVCLTGESLDDQRGETDISELLGILSSSMPVKILFQTDNILSGPDDSQGPFSSRISQDRLAALAVGTNNAFVVQSGIAGLYQLRHQIAGGIRFEGPALVSLFSGASTAETVSPYLMSAAATESRAFPTFTFDPAAGPDWASRFSLDGNPQVDRSWPSHPLAYEDQDLQKISEDVAFTLADYAACDDRFSGYFEQFPESVSRDDLVSLADFLDGDEKNPRDGVPYVSIVDESNSLHRMLVTERLVRAARRCADNWRSLQELGGIDNSHAEQLLKKEREVREEKSREVSTTERVKAEQAVVDTPPNDGPTATIESNPVPYNSASAETAEAPSDGPYIETPRCTTCNECTQINDRLFAYDENQQAYIADPDAGTFKELVDAAENCQVAIIHPGKPRNPDEPNLLDLMTRAEAFA